MFALSSLALSLLATLNASAYTVKDFHPQGTVKSPRQVRIVFSEPMIPFGDPRGIEPFKIDCTRTGKGTWEDSRTWIYEFEKELGAGEGCKFTAKRELKSDKGGAFEGKAEFSFETGGPAIKRSEPYEGSSIEQKPAFLLQLDGKADEASVEKHAYLLVEGLPERIPLKVVSGKMKEEILKQSRRNYYGEGDEEGGQEDSEQSNTKMFPIVLESSRSLPPNVRVQLVWGKGIKGAKGAATTEDQMIAYRTQQDFTATFSCQRENENSPCLPIGEMSVRFSSEVERKVVEKTVLKAGSFTLKPELNSKDNTISYLSFKGPFPPNTKFTVVLPGGIKDEQGRALTNQDKFPLEVSTGGYPPLAKFSSPFGIVEAKDPVLPVTLRNIEAKVASTKLVGSKVNIGAADPVALMNWVLKLRSRHDNYFRYEKEKQIDLRGESLIKGEKGLQKFELPKPNGAQAFEVIGIPLGEKGFHVVELESKLLGVSMLGKPAPMYVAAGALVTNLAVHFKWGVESSLVWVTSLEEGKPVKGAKVRATDCHGKTIWEGKTDENGTALTEALPNTQGFNCTRDNGEGFTSGLVVLAEKDGDFSFVHSGWDDGIESWRFHLPTSYGENDESMAHTVLDRTLFRAGQEAHMKHFLREPFLRGIRYKKEGMPKSLVLLHSSGKKIVMPVKFGGSGTAENEWKIPKDAELGTYSIYLTVDDQSPAKGKSGEEQEFRTWGKGVYRSGSFRVEEFRLPVMAGTVQWPKGTLVGVKDVPLDISVRYLSGGGASGLSVKLRSRAEKFASASFDGYEGFNFANGGIKAGRFNRSASEQKEKTDKTFPEQKFTLDGGGGARAVVKGIPVWDVPTRVMVEAEYRDPNGEVQSVGRDTMVYPGNSVVGIMPDGWAAQKDKVKFRVAVLTPEGKPLDGKKVKVEWLEKESFSHRKRIVGGFYAYENFEEIRDKGEACSGKTNEKGLLFCDVKAPATGSMVLVAESEGSRAHQEIYVAGDDSWFAQDNDDRIDLLPEKKAYEGGETARFQVRSPFRNATALVTVEREGVIDRYIREVDGKNPVIEVPVKESYAPNVFVSAFLVRGRVGDPVATALIDLAKPAHKLGIAEISVGWKAHRLNVQVETDRTEFKVREKAKVKVKVNRALDGKPSRGEVVLVAIDEALLELMPNNSWKLLDAMMGRRSLKVRTSTAQSQVVGKRHFGVKALPPGGGGGQSSARELFDTLLYWKATLPLKDGEAEAEVPMNDSLSSFRIVAIASEDADKFGTGQKSVRTRQDLMLFSGVAPLARHGDKTFPEVTVRNAGEKALKAEVRLKVNGKAQGAQNVELTPGASKSVSWPLLIPNKGDSQVFEFEAKSGDARDSLKVTQKLEPALRESVLQSTLERVEGKLSMPVEQAKGSLPDTGGVTVRLEKSLAANLDGVKRYMEGYPYGCLEQRTSKAVALRDEKAWDGIAKNLSSYIDGQGLLKYFPEGIYGSDTLTSYFLAVTNEAGYQIPEDDLRKIIGGLQNFVTGKSYYAGFLYPAADLAIRKLNAMEALSRYQSFSPDYLALIQLEPNLWPMRALVDWYNLLKREQAIPEREKKLAQAEQIIRARVEWRGTVLGFKGSSRMWWLMSSMDEEANKLLLSASSDEKWNSDIGRLVRGSIARMQRGHWDLTTANAWGVLAMERFSSKHEKEAVSGVTTSLLGDKKAESKWNGDKGVEPVSFPWPKAKTDLTVSHNGSGKPWALLEARAAVKLTEPISKGYRMKRTVKPVEQKEKGKWSVGDVYRVTLEIEAPADMTWVVVADPIPAGATVLGSGLGNDSSFLTKGEKQKGYSWGTFEERGFSGFRSYHEWMPKGSHQVEYTVRLNAAGTFQLPNSRVEAMYAPEMYSESGNDSVTVQK